MGCIFCKIVAGDIPSAKVYEDEKVMAFLDINPVSKGHILLIPKDHHEMMVDMPDDLLAYSFVKAKEIMPRLKEVLEADFIALSVVGIDVPHFHIHLIPRYEGDGLKDFWPTKKYDEGEMEMIADKIKIN